MHLQTTVSHRVEVFDLSIDPLTLHLLLPSILSLFQKEKLGNLENLLLELWYIKMK